MANRWGKKWEQCQVSYSWAPKSLWPVTAATKLKDSCALEKKQWQTSRVWDMTLLTKDHIVRALVFQVVMYGCESWIIKKAVSKNWCFWTVVLEKTLESPSDSKEITVVNPKGNQPWIFIWRTDAKAEAPILATWCKELMLFNCDVGEDFWESLGLQGDETSQS